MNPNNNKMSVSCQDYLIESSKDPDEAKTQWDVIAPVFQEKIINNVWCPHCGTKTTMVNFDGITLRKALILRGFCITCSKPVARVLEGDTK